MLSFEKIGDIYKAVSPNGRYTFRIYRSGYEWKITISIDMISIDNTDMTESFLIVTDWSNTLKLGKARCERFMNGNEHAYY
jgi:hypothetical protein